MVIVVGLGNPGKTYENTYHNLGFMVLDKLASFFGVSFGKVKYKSIVAESFYEGEKVLLVKPQTFMNNSGEAVTLLKKDFKDARIIVVVDDIDLPAGAVRYREHGSAGTHNGLRSIVSFIGQEFERVKVGTGRDENTDLADFVLSKIKGNFDETTDKARDMVLEKIKNK